MCSDGWRTRHGRPFLRSKVHGRVKVLGMGELPMELGTFPVGSWVMPSDGVVEDGCRSRDSVLQAVDRSRESLCERERASERASSVLTKGNKRFYARP